MAVVGLPCCMWAFSSCGEQGYSLGVVRGLLIAVASLVTEHRLRGSGFSSCGTQDQEWLEGSGAQAQQGSNPCPLHWQQILYHWTTREVQKMVFKVRTSAFSESRT